MVAWRATEFGTFKWFLYDLMLLCHGRIREVVSVANLLDGMVREHFVPNLFVVGACYVLFLAGFLFLGLLAHQVAVGPDEWLFSLYG